MSKRKSSQLIESSGVSLSSGSYLCGQQSGEKSGGRNSRYIKPISRYLHSLILIPLARQLFDLPLDVLKLILYENDASFLPSALLLRCLSKHAHQVSRRLPVSWVLQRFPSSKTAKVIFLIFLNFFIAHSLSTHDELMRPSFRKWHGHFP